jgi:hypothetical protein
MGAINTAAYLASIRSKMDAQQQVVAMLEGELQKAILGGGNRTLQDLADTDVTNTDSIAYIYDQAGIDAGATGTGWVTTINNVITTNFGAAVTDPADQDALRQLLYQARALLGELRVEEQAWNAEVNSEKTLRKEVNDFAKV